MSCLDQAPAGDPLHRRRLAALTTLPVCDQRRGDPEQPSDRFAASRVIGARRRERLDERPGRDVRNIGRLAQAPGSKADNPRHMPSIEDLERAAIGAERTEQLTVAVIAVHTCDWSQQQSA